MKEPRVRKGREGMSVVGKWAVILLGMNWLGLDHVETKARHL